MFVLAVQRGARWIYRPRGTFVLQEGDRLISVGPEEGEEELWQLTGAPARGRELRPGTVLVPTRFLT